MDIQRLAARMQVMQQKAMQQQFRSPQFDSEEYVDDGSEDFEATEEFQLPDPNDGPGPSNSNGGMNGFHMNQAEDGGYYMQQNGDYDEDDEEDFPDTMQFVQAEYHNGDEDDNDDSNDVDLAGGINYPQCYNGKEINFVCFALV